MRAQSFRIELEVAVALAQARISWPIDSNCRRSAQVFPEIAFFFVIRLLEAVEFAAVNPTPLSAKAAQRPGLPRHTWEDASVRYRRSRSVIPSLAK